ncbi:hypothetical protein RD792_001199 [Penstemon davidsonii]|uniref:RRM domain-containing protein n=1 Tax=Penstemon davidsonii TaxID=160366 RepID=A0ABR0DMT2_9LAMI|nr:hypothetical protein RD792_001199 [Penstemon davidsonii]
MEPNNKKLFIGGISQATNEESLFEYFAKYGEIKKSEVIRDRVTGFSRGFGFITFSEPSSAEKALQDQHVILGRTVEVTIPRPKYEKYGPNYYQHINNTEINGGDSQIRSSINPKKIFVGGLPSSLTSGEFKEYFDSFGTVIDSVIIYDKIYNKSRGFGFVTFDSEEATDNVLRRVPHTLNNKVVDVKRAIPKEEISSNYAYNFSYVAGFPYTFDPYSYYSFPSYSQCYYQATPYVLPFVYESSPLSNNASPYIRTEAYVNGHWIHEDVFNTYGSSSSSQARSTPISCQRQRVRITTPSSCNNNAQGQLVSYEESNGSSFQNQQENATQLRLEEQNPEVNVGLSAKDDVISKESCCTQLSLDDDKSEGCIGEEIAVMSSNGAKEVLSDEESDCKSIQNRMNDVCLPKITTQLKLEDNIGVEEEQSPNVE